ncbi:hypothetical protein, partial [uncultured Cardiobacterium sp.]|uniref:hypothetical protein n=1 Tax=uncultured Cardiobacterium sp. TaxID=417619 RepID=UPI002603D3E6
MEDALWPGSRKHPRPDLANICGVAAKEVMEDALWPGSRKHPRPDLANICGVAAKEVMEDALWPGSRNIHALTWPTFAARRNWQLDKLGSPAARKSWEMRWPSSRKHPSPDLANICGPAE